MNPLKKAAKSVLEFGAANFGMHRWPSRKPRLWILMYHRIIPADDPRTQEEEPGMVVTPTTFRRHIQWLKDEFEFIQLSEWIERSVSGRALPPKACAITFDDGWSDNFEFAFPILKETSTPATIFAVSHMIGTNQTFWPNRLARILRSSDYIRIQAPGMAWLNELIDQSTDSLMSRDQISAVISRAKSIADHEVLSSLEAIEDDLRIEPSSKDSRSLLSWEELDAMCRTGYIEVGSHTCYHTRLNDQIPPQIVAREITDSKRLLEERLGRPVTLFCYPNGEWTPEASSMVRKHYHGAVTTKIGINSNTTDMYALMRVAVHEDISDRQSGLYARLSGSL